MGIRNINLSVGAARGLLRKFSLLSLSMLLGTFLVLQGYGGAVSDSTAPTLSAITLDRSTATASLAGDAVTMTVDINDDISGFFHGDITYTSPSGGQVASGYFFNNDPYAGEYEGFVSFNSYIESGVWTPTFTLLDQSGNSRTYTSTDLEAMEIDANITVSGESDTTTSVLTGLTKSVSSLDTTNGTATIEFNATFTDELSGCGLNRMRIISPTGIQSRSVELMGGSDSCSSVAIVTLEQYSESGTWGLEVTAIDNAGNSVVYDTVDLANLGFASNFSVTGSSDTEGPTVTALNFDVADPVINEVPFGGGVMTLNAQFTDNMSGVQGAVVTYDSPTTTQNSSNSFYFDAENNVWSTSVYLPVYAASGSWVPTLTLYDNTGNSRTYSPEDLDALSLLADFVIAKNITSSVTAGGTVSSDTENDGATPTDVVEAAVTSPVEGQISIVMIDGDHITDQTNGYAFFGRQISINAPVATVEDPLTLAFRIDASVVPVGESAATLQVMKNGVALGACLNSTSADPDACVFERNTLGDGDIEVKIHSTTASVWNSGFPIATNFEFHGFFNPVKNPPKVNKVGAKDVVPVKFDLGAYYGLDVLESGYPKSQRINCTTNAPIGDAVSTLSAKPAGLKYKEGKGIYRYDWRTLKAWKNTCRQLIVKLTDGSTHYAYFKFE